MKFKAFPVLLLLASLTTLGVGFSSWSIEAVYAYNELGVSAGIGELDVTEEGYLLFSDLGSSKNFTLTEKGISSDGVIDCQGELTLSLGIYFEGAKYCGHTSLDEDRNDIFSFYSCVSLYGYDGSLLSSSYLDSVAVNENDLFSSSISGSDEALISLTFYDSIDTSNVSSSSLENISSYTEIELVYTFEDSSSASLYEASGGSLSIQIDIMLEIDS